MSPYGVCERLAPIKMAEGGIREDEKLKLLTFACKPLIFRCVVDKPLETHPSFSFSSFPETPSVTASQLASRGPVTKATASASQLSPESAVIGVCSRGPSDTAGRESPPATSMTLYPPSVVVDKGHLNAEDLGPALCPQKLAF